MPPAPLDTATADTLVARAKAAAEAAYCPASGFPVGAAVLSAGGAIHSGCNVENASYGLTICAERNALCHAVAAGDRELIAVAVWTDLSKPAAPCGACRQVLAEFGPDMWVMLVGRDGEPRTVSLGQLLPEPFVFDREKQS